MDGRLYHESQKIMPVMMALLGGIICVGIAAFTLYVSMITEDIPITSVTGIVLIASMALILVVSFVLFVLRIKITVTHGSLNVGVFKGRTVPIEDIHSVEKEEFRAFRDYFGWGLRLGRKGFGYIVAGTNDGLRINLKDGKSFFISSKRTFEFESAMNVALKAAKKVN
jgi:hypothetical protein